ncbi:MAG: nuclear transport factor 2 family protein, partial [Proteobacteria bacterium]
DQSEVWQMILASYVDIDNKDVNWSEKWSTKDALVWGNAYPMPRNIASVKRWDAYQFPLSENMVSEYSPVGIVVHGSTAVAHYYYSNGDKNKEGKHKTTHGRCTDIVVKEGQQWKFVSWHCADAPDNN